VAATTIFCSSSLRAEISLTFIPSSSSIVEGTSGFVDVMISSTTSEALDAYFFRVNILSGPVAAFGTQSESFLNDPSYVFFQRSANVANGITATSIDSGGSYATVGDVSYDFALNAVPEASLPVTLPDSSSPKLLARLQFNAVSQGTFTFEIDQTNTSFNDVGLGLFNFSSTNTQFTVTAVPEPNSFIIAILLGTGGMMYRIRSGRQKADSKAVVSGSECSNS